MEKELKIMSRPRHKKIEQMNKVEKSYIKKMDSSATKPADQPVVPDSMMASVLIARELNAQGSSEEKEKSYQDKHGTWNIATTDWKRCKSNL